MYTHILRDIEERIPTVITEKEITTLVKKIEWYNKKVTQKLVIKRAIEDNQERMTKIQEIIEIPWKYVNMDIWNELIELYESLVEIMPIKAPSPEEIIYNEENNCVLEAIDCDHLETTLSSWIVCENTWLMLQEAWTPYKPIKKR